MATIYKTWHDLDGIDQGQKLWQIFNDKGSCIWAVSDNDEDITDDIVRYIGTNLYSVHRRDDAEGFAVMLRHDERVKRMMGEVVRTIAKWWDEDSFVLDDDWYAGYETGRRSLTMPRVPRGRDRYHYECGAALGMMSHVAGMTDVDYDFIETWVTPYKARENPYNE